MFSYPHTSVGGTVAVAYSPLCILILLSEQKRTEGRRKNKTKHSPEKPWDHNDEKLLNENENENEATEMRKQKEMGKGGEPSKTFEYSRIHY